MQPLPIQLIFLSVACSQCFFALQAQAWQGVSSQEFGNMSNEDAQQMDEDGPLYLGVRHGALFAKLGLDGKRKGVSPSGAFYRFENDVAQSGIRIEHIVLGVYSTLTEARFRYQREALMIPAPEAEAGEEFGSAYTLWKTESDDSGTLLVREKNILLGLSFSGTSDAVKKRILFILDTIRSDRAIAPIADWEIKPEIELKEIVIPKSAPEDGTTFVLPRVLGLESREFDVSTSLDGNSWNYHRLTDEGELRIFNEMKSYANELFITVVDELNVVVTQKVKLVE